MPKKPTKLADAPSVEAAYIIMDAMDAVQSAHIRLKDDAHISGNLLLIAATEPGYDGMLRLAKACIKEFRRMRDAYLAMSHSEHKLVCELDFLHQMDADRLERMRESHQHLKAAHRRFLAARTQVHIRRQAYKAAAPQIGVVKEVKG